MSCSFLLASVLSCLNWIFLSVLCDRVNIWTGHTVFWKLTVGISREKGKWQVAALRDLTFCPSTALLPHEASALFLPRCWLPSSLPPPLRARIELCCSFLSPLPLSPCYICHLFTRTPTGDSFILHLLWPPEVCSSWDNDYLLLCSSLIQRSLLVAGVLYCREMWLLSVKISRWKPYQVVQYATT